MAGVDIDIFIKQSNAMINALAQSSPDILQRIANDATAMLKNRVIQRGETAEETSFPAYSPGYEKVRAKKGLNSKPNRLVFTGSMLRDLGIVSTQIQDNKYTVTVSAKSSDNIQKLSYNSDQYGDVMKLSKTEEKELDITYADEITRILKANGF